MWSVLYFVFYSSKLGIYEGKLWLGACCYVLGSWWWVQCEYRLYIYMYLYCGKCSTNLTRHNHIVYTRIILYTIQTLSTINPEYPLPSDEEPRSVYTAGRSLTSLFASTASTLGIPAENMISCATTKTVKCSDWLRSSSELVCFWVYVVLMMVKGG